MKQGYINVVSFFVCVTNLRSFKESSMKDRRSKTVRLQQRDLFVSLAWKKGINNKTNKQSQKYWFYNWCIPIKICSILVVQYNEMHFLIFKISLWPWHSNIQFPLASRSTHCAVTSKNIYSHSVPSDISGDQRWAVSAAEPQEPRPLSLLDPLSSGFDHNRWSIIINQVLWLPLIRGDVSQSVVLGNQGSQAAFASFDLKKHSPS